MHFNTYTVIRPLFDNEDGDAVPDYCDLSSITPGFGSRQLYDVPGIALFIEPKRTITKKDGSAVDVQELVIIDHSVKYPITISVWGDLASKECDRVYSAIDSAPVIGITSLRVSNYKGFSLSTSLSTRFIFEHSGDKAVALSTWASNNVQLHNSKREKVQEVRLSKAKPKLVNVADLKKKQEDDIILDEQVWLCGHVAEFGKKKVRLYLGCDSCGQKSDVDSGGQFTCISNYCRGKVSMSAPWMTLPFDFADETGTMSLLALTEDATKILGASAEHLHSMPYEEHDRFLSKNGQALLKKTCYVHVVPAPAMAVNNMLKWLLKRVSFEHPTEI